MMLSAENATLKNTEQINPPLGFQTPKFHYLAYLRILACILCNGCVVYLVLVRLRKANQLRPSNLLITHLAMATTLFGVSTLFVTIEKTGPLYTPEQLCRIVAFTKSAVHSLFLTSLFAITYERLNAIKGARTSLIDLLSIIWSLSLAFSAPSAFTTVPVSDFNYLVEQNITVARNTTTSISNCRAVKLLHSTEATLLHELFRFLLFGIGNAVFMLYAVVKIRSIINNLQQSPAVTTTSRMSRKLRSVKMIYLNFTLFVLISVPNEIQIFLRRVLARSSFDQIKKSVIVDFIWSKAAFFFMVGTGVYIYLMPLILLFMLEGKALWCGSVRARSDQSSTHALHRRASKRRAVDSSRFSTANPSTCSDAKHRSQVNSKCSEWLAGLSNVPKETLI